MSGSVILSGARTPIGKLSGSLAGFAATDLGGFAIKAALERSLMLVTALAPTIGYDNAAKIA